jgi:phage replication-related protein YjqB (UPF0714/DUF867 family)
VSPHGFADLLATPGVEEHSVLAGPVGVMAFHGGLEGGTEVIAARAAAATGASLYTVVQPPNLRWHLPSHRVGAGASPRLSAFLEHVEVAIAVHGYGRPGRSRHLLVGGTNRRLAALLADALRRHLPGWEAIDDLAEIPAEMRGVHPDNPVNRPRHGGVQLELPATARGAPRPGSGDAGPAVPLPGVVDALVEVIHSSSGRRRAHSTSKLPPARQ